MNKKQLLGSLRTKSFNEKIISAFEKVRREDFFLKKLKNMLMKIMHSL